MKRQGIKGIHESLGILFNREPTDDARVPLTHEILYAYIKSPENGEAAVERSKALAKTARVSAFDSTEKGLQWQARTGRGREDLDAPKAIDIIRAVNAAKRKCLIHDDDVVNMEKCLLEGVAPLSGAIRLMLAQTNIPTPVFLETCEKTFGQRLLAPPLQQTGNTTMDTFKNVLEKLRLLSGKYPQVQPHIERIQRIQSHELVTYREIEQILREDSNLSILLDKTSEEITASKNASKWTRSHLAQALRMRNKTLDRIIDPENRDVVVLSDLRAKLIETLPSLADSFNISTEKIMMLGRNTAFWTATTHEEDKLYKTTEQFRVSSRL